MLTSRVPAALKPTGRLEYKHLVPYSQLAELRAALKPYVRPDSFCESRPNHEYTVRSIYYDNRRFTCYWEKFDGFRLKKKFRIRGYNTPEPDGMVFLEIKRREEDFIHKSRAPLRWDQLGAVFGGYGPNGRAWPFTPGTPHAEAAGRFLYNYYRRRLLPVVLIAYEREAFIGRFDPSLRLTIDKNVRSRMYPELESLYQDRDARFLTPGHFVFEVKFYMVLPKWVRAVTHSLHLQRQAFSKYAAGFEVQPLARNFLRGVGHTAEFPRLRPAEPAALARSA